MNNLNHCRTLSVRFLASALLLTSAGSALAEVHYVDVNSTNATPPYTNWATAATNIQDAVDAAVAGEEIVVTNGVYQTGARDVYGMSNRVAVTKPVAVRSVNGSAVTSIVGYGPKGPAAVRCVYLTNAALLVGFTLTNGATQTSGDFFTNQAGGGVWCESSSAVVSNCVLTRNSALQGGGAFSGTLINCTLAGDSGNFAGGFVGGGGALSCTLINCRVINNLSNNGGGASSCTLNNCTLSGNQARQGGGAIDSTLNNCTLVGNSANMAGNDGYDCTFNNCVVLDGTAFSLALNNCFTTGDPLFVDAASGNLRLQPNSPCINAGKNSYVTSATDLDSNPRISGGTVDIGAYEFQWPQLTIVPSGTNVFLSWPTNTAGYDYTGFTLQSTTNLVSPAVWTTNSPAPVVIGDQNVVTNPLTGPQQFYRLVQ